MYKNNNNVNDVQNMYKAAGVYANNHPVTNSFNAAGFYMGGGFDALKELNAQDTRKKLQEQAQSFELEQAKITGQHLENTGVDLENQKLRQQIENSQYQLDMLNNQIMAKDLDNALIDYSKTKDAEGFNIALKNNKRLASKIQNLYGVSRIENLDLVNNQKDRDLFNQMSGFDRGMLDKIYQLNPEQLEDLQNSFVITDGAKGKNIVSLDGFMQRTGTMTRVTKEQGQSIQNVLDRTRAVGQLLSSDQVKAMEMQEFYANNPDAKWGDFEQSKTKTPKSLDEVQAQEVYRLMQEEGLSYGDAYNRLNVPEELKEDNKLINTKTDAVMRLTELDKKALSNELTEEEKIEQQNLRQYVQGEGDEARSLLDKTNEFYVNLTSGVDDVTEIVKNTDTKILNSVAADFKKNHLYKQDSTLRKELTNGMRVVKAGDTIRNAYNSLTEEEIDNGIADKTITAALTKLSDTQFNELPESQRNKIIKSINLETKVGKYLAAYLKETSGTAVAQAEYVRLRDILVGSGFNNTQARRMALNSFLDEQEKSYKTLLTTSAVTDPASSIAFARQYNNRKDTIKSPEELGKLKGVDVTNTDNADNTNNQDNNSNIQNAAKIKYSNLIGKVNPVTGKKLVDIDDNGQPVWEESK